MNPPGERKRSPSRRRRNRGGGGGQPNRAQGQGGDRGRGFQDQRGRRGGGGGPGRRVVDSIPEGEPTLEVQGVLQIAEAGHGHLRAAKYDFCPEPGDPIVPRALILELKLETGVELAGTAVTRDDGGPPIVARAQPFSNGTTLAWADRRQFKDLVAEDPDERIQLESSGDEISTRVVDLIAPIGKGQRCLIVAPPKAGKTVLLQKIAASVSANHPEIHLCVLLVDERPEEVTDMRRHVNGEVIASSSDETPKRHIQIAELALERCKRLVECGRDVVILLDSITRLARAYNSEQRGSGRVLSGGIDARTMEKPRRFFGAARKAVGGGSLTVIGTALVDTGSRMDEVIFQEFKGTGNTEILMDRGLFEQRIFPAIDIAATGTRKEEKLLTPIEYQKVTLLRRALAPLRAGEAMQLLTGRLAKHPSNAIFLETMV